MSELLPLKDRIVYGPVRSRRLGSSLGINLLPPGRKYCSFDCLYCQYGWTPAASIDRRGEAKEFPALEEAVRSIETALANLPEPPAYLTFSGNGEPTLHPDFPRIVEAVVSLRNRLAPGSKTALLSNSGFVGNPDVCRAIPLLDQAFLKFEAGNESMFRAMNRPVPSIKYDALVSGLEALREISLQSLFTAGSAGNIESAHVAAWIERVKRIRPRNVQIYTLSRPVPSPFIVPASRAALEEIHRRLCREGISAEIF